LKLVEECLVVLGFEEERARNITASLHQLHYIRSKVKGHTAGQDATKIRRQALAEHRTYGEHFRALCAQCDEAIRTITDAFKGFS
jgi:hypothetical protein